MIKKLLSLSKK